MAECKDVQVSSTQAGNPEVVEWYEDNRKKVCKQIELAKFAIEEYNKSVVEYNNVRNGANGWAPQGPANQTEIDTPNDNLNTAWQELVTKYSSSKTHSQGSKSEPDGFKSPLDGNYYIAAALKTRGDREDEHWYKDPPSLNAYEEILYAQSIRGGSAHAAGTTTWTGNNFAAKVQAAANNLKKLREELEAVAAEAGVDGLSDDDAALLDESGNIKEGLDNDQRAQAERARERIVNEELKGVAIVHDSDHTTPAFKEQCFLLDQISTLVEYKRNKLEHFHPKDLPYADTTPDKNACLMVDGNPYGFINELTQHQAQGAFFNMKTEEISSLQPMIRLFKINYDKDDPNKEFQQEFNFDSYASKKDVDSLFSDKAKRGFGVGIKNFSFVYDGNNPFAAKKSIKASLTIFASSFDELLVDRGGYKYADLALKTGKTKKKPDTETSEQCDDINDEDLENNLEKLNFRLKAVVGWAQPSGDKSIFTSTTAAGKHSVINAINESHVTLNLTPTMHEFKIDDMGRVNFTCNYLAYVEDFFDQPQFDIFYKEEVVKRTISRKFRYKELSKKCSAAELGEYKRELSESGIVRDDKYKNMQSLMRALRDNKKIRYVNIPVSSLAAIESLGPFYKETVTITDEQMAPGDLQRMMAESITSRRDEEEDPTAFEKKQLNILDNAKGKTAENVSFFYISDLIDVIFKRIEKRLKAFSQDATWDKETFPDIDPKDKEKEIEAYKKFHQQFKKFRVLLGPLEIVDPKDNTKVKSVNLGDVPISVKHFMEWLSETLLKNDQVRYNLNKFLNDFFNSLVRDFLNNDTCFSYNTKQKTRLNQAAITSYKAAGDTQDEITKAILGRQSVTYTRPSRAIMKTLTKPVLNISGPQDLPISEGGIENEINYLVYFVGRTQPTELMNGSQVEDEKRGIFHYLIGKPRGIVKNIELSKTDARYLKEVRFQQEGFDGLEQLREVYDVNIGCYANVKTFPGTYIYVDPRGFAPNTTSYEGGIMDLTRYGIGGYHMIIRSEHKFGPGEANTTITAKWVAQIEHEAEMAECETKKEPAAGDNSKTNCPVAQDEDSGAWYDFMTPSTPGE